MTNLAIAVSVSVGVVWVGEVLSATALGLGVGTVTLVGSLVSIYFRGYLVPGTPTLTRRYFPRWLLQVFGKAPPQAESVDTAVSAEADVTLTDDDVLDSESGGDGEARLDPAIYGEWQAAVEDIGAIEDPVEIVDTDESVDGGDFMGIYRLYVDDAFAGKWRSEAALLADAASYSVLSAHLDDWDDRSPDDQLRLLDRFREHVGTCPNCGVETVERTESVNGCCTTFEATVDRCPECDAEFDIDRCPDCGHGTEYVTETAEIDAGTVEFGSLNCADCDERVRSVPECFTAPDG